MKRPPARWLTGPAKVTITRSGRISYSITIHQDVWLYGPWFALGSRAHAEAKARRVFRRFLRRKARSSDVTTITTEDLG